MLEAEQVQMQEQMLEQAEAEEKAEQIAQELDLSPEELLKENLKQEISERFNVPENVADLALKLYLERKKEDLQVTKQALNILPALAKSDNPLVMLAVSQLLGQRKEKSGEDDLVKAFKEIQILSTIPAMQTAMMKKMLESMGSDDTSKIMLQYLIKKSEEAENRFRELLLKMLEEKNEERLAELKEEVREVVSQMVETVNMVMDKMAYVVENMKSPQPQPQPQERDPMEELRALREKLETTIEMLKSLGFDIKPPGSIDPLELKLKEVEVQAKLKEIELKEKEIMAKQELMKAIGEGVKNLLSNPDALVKLVQSFTGFLRPTKPAADAMAKAVELPPELETSDLELDLEDLVEEVKDEGNK